MDTKLDRHMEGTRFKSYMYIYVYILALEVAMFIKVVSCINEKGNLGIFGPIITF